VETRRPDAKGTKYKLHMGSVKAWTEMDGRKTPLQLPADKLLAGPQANAYFPVRPDGTVLERSTDDLAENDHPENLRRKFAHLLNRIANGYELTCLPAPVAEMRPGTTWGTKLTTQMVYADTTQLVDIVVRCVYEGLRVRDGQRQASIALQGRVEDGTTSRSLDGSRVRSNSRSMTGLSRPRTRSWKWQTRRWRCTSRDLPGSCLGLGLENRIATTLNQ
jgi:hypothetical protein